MTTAPTFDDILAVMSGAAAGDDTLRVRVPDSPQLDHVPTRFALALNVLLDDHASRLKAVERLADAERAATSRFTRLAASGIIGIIVASFDGRVVEVNDALLDLVGYGRDEILSGAVAWASLTPSEWRSLDDVAREQLDTVGVATLREKEYLHKDGTRLPVLVGSAMLEGAAKRTISFVLDLRGSKRAEDAIAHLREALASEATFRSFVEAAPDAVIIADHVGKIVLVNSQMEKLFGYTRAELVGQHLEMLLPERHRQKPERRAAYFADAKTRLAGAPRELDGLRKDGSEFPLEVSAGILEREGEWLITSAIRDVTERRKSEELRSRLAAIVSSSDDAIIGKTLEGIITSWNDGAHRMFGYTAGEAIERSVTMLIPPERKHEEQEILEHLAEGKVERFDTVRVRKDGRMIDVSVTSSPIRDSTGRLIGASKIVRDISDRRRAEEALARAKDAAEAANHELEAFSYSVAHDLRAPLRGMNGFARVLLDKYGNQLDADAKDWLEEILLNAAKMGALIDALLSLARLTRSEPRHEIVDLSAMTRVVAKDLAMAEPARSVELVVEDHLSADVDPTLVRALLDNLIGNAWKFTGQVAHARIEFGATEAKGVRAFFVRDNGAGFDMAYADKLFGPFQRLHTAEEFPGTGIGLATVQRIVHRHGGRIWAESAVAAGATFYFTFPPRTLK